MKEHPIDVAASIVGSKAALGRALGVSKSAVEQWTDEDRKVPAKHCPAIERLTDGKVRCEDLNAEVDWTYLRQAADSTTEVSA
jgi:DNA-binding transcriptional regulator YdaS (Cro superfamily)